MYFMLLFITLLHGVEPVIVEVKEGLLSGVERERSTGGKYLSFKNIPYAAPPVGELRFKAPEPPLPWKGVRDATEHGPVCPQVEIATLNYIPGDEDCLTLNVYTPSLNPENLLPIMFFIHGGGFISGSGNDDEYGPDFLLDNNVIVITCNYRLGVLGFLTLDIEEVPGNAGLKDQVAALKWIKHNIVNFGGNPNNVTIFGQSAGGTSVSLHTVSPMSKDLFNRGIAMSGVFLNDFSQAFEQKRRAYLLCQKLGAYVDDPYSAYYFLKNESVQSLITTQPCFIEFEKHKSLEGHFFPFLPVVEKDFGGEHFLTEDPKKLLKTGKVHVDEVILGHTSEESIYDVTITPKITEKLLKIYSQSNIMFAPAKIIYERTLKEALSISGRIQKHYFGNQVVSSETIKDFVKCLSYIDYIYDIYRYAEMWPRSKKIYFYGFYCHSERNVYGNYGLKYGIKGASHLDDLMYIFDGKRYNFTINKSNESYKMIKQTTTLFTNFATHGNPTPDDSLGVVWKEYQNNSSMLLINSTLRSVMGKSPEIEFWRTALECEGYPFA